MPAGRWFTQPCGALTGAPGPSVGFSYSVQTSRAEEHDHCFGTPVTPSNLEHAIFKCNLSVGSFENRFIHKNPGRFPS